MSEFPNLPLPPKELLGAPNGFDGSALGVPAPESLVDGLNVNEEGPM
jgi:hypothetical protein